MTDPTKAPNRLANETSPYLLQHAHNPVDWWPWCDEAFVEAERRDVPVLLSSGYSACHWCHVMAHESFEDEDVARVLNGHFVCIKLDREERPDVDALYMSACMAVTGQGGWPLNVLLTPQREPFFAFTYLPKTRSRGQMGFLDLLARVHELWVNERGQPLQTAANLLKILAEEPSKGELGVQDADAAARQLLGIWDREYGGFGRAPKFPSPHQLLFLMHWAQSKPAQSEAWQAVASQLDGMMHGGIRDLLGGGFCRYATDRKWKIPHFEKMLYDNALLLLAYTQGYQRLGTEAYAQAAAQIVQYLLREMRDAEGGFYTAQDADSEQGEGAYYLWKPAQVLSVLGQVEGKRFCQLCDITEQGNFEGKSMPNTIDKPLSAADGKFIRRCAEALYAARQLRMLPMTDIKILLSSNGLAIAALAYAARTFASSEWLEAARDAAGFVLEHMTRDGGRLFGSHTMGAASHEATLDGYAFFVWGLIELYQASGEAGWLTEALKWQQAMRAFEDGAGGLFFSSSHSGDLPVRIRNAQDGAVPSAHAVAASNLIRLSHLTGNAELSQWADRLIASLASEAKGAPLGYTALYSAVLLREELVDVVLVPGEGFGQMRSACALFAPALTLAVAGSEEMRRVAPFTEDMKALSGKATAYVCHAGACGEPITDPDLLRQKVTQHVHMPPPV